MHATQQTESELVPFTGTSAHFCKRCGGYDVPLYQQDLGKWQYAYYCCEPPPALRLVPKPPVAKGINVKAVRAKQERYRIGGAEIVLEALQAEPLPFEQLLEISGMTRNSLINLLSSLRRSGKILTVKRTGADTVVWHGLVEHREQLDVIAAELKRSRPLTPEQSRLIAYLDQQPACLRAIADAACDGKVENCWAILRVLKQRGILKSRLVGTSMTAIAWYCLADQEHLLEAELNRLDDQDRPVLMRYCRANPGCVEKQIKIDLGLNQQRARRTLERMVQDGDAVVSVLHRYKRYTLTPQGESKCRTLSS